MAILLIFLSFLLEGFFTNLVSLNSIFIPLFTLTSLIMLYPFFDINNNSHKYIIVAIVFGLLYDIVYTNSSFINTISFSLCSLLIIFINHYLNPSILLKLGILLTIIIIYRIFTYLLLCAFNYLNFSENILIKGIYSSLLVNIIFGLILYFLSNFISKKLNIRKYTR